MWCLVLLRERKVSRDWPATVFTGKMGRSCLGMKSILKKRLGQKRRRRKRETETDRDTEERNGLCPLVLLKALDPAMPEVGYISFTDKLHKQIRNTPMFFP